MEKLVESVNGSCLIDEKLALFFDKDIVKIVYERGEFKEYAVNLTTLALFGYGFGVFFTGLRDILNSTLFSMGKTKTTTINGIIGVIINIILNYIKWLKSTSFIIISYIVE